MSKRREIRSTHLRAADINGQPGVTLKVVTPNVVDDYGSVFMPDTFDESLTRRAPVLCWAHEWEDPLGPYVSHTADTDGAPVISFRFSDFEAVPSARRAHAQVSDGTIVDCSVGFSNTERRSPTEDEVKRWPGVREVITKADLDEVSLVLRGAVPGAKVLSIRSGQVDIDAVVEIAKRKAAGELTDAEAQAAIDLLAQDKSTDAGADNSGTDSASSQASGGGSEDTDPDTAALDAELDAALETIGRSAPRREKRFVDLMADDVRRMLDVALRDRLMPTPGEQWVWIRDFSDTVVVFDTEGSGWGGTYRLGYSLQSGSVVLDSSNPQRVVPKTTYTEA